MSRGPENRFIASIHRLLPADLYHMKNHNSYVGGPADVWYSGKRGDLWIEYKYVKNLPRVIDLMDLKKSYCLSALQQEWLRNRFREGRNVTVVLGYEKGGIVFTSLEWESRWDYPGDKETESRLEIATWIAETTKGTYEAPPKRSGRVERCV